MVTERVLEKLKSEGLLTTLHLILENIAVFVKKHIISIEKFIIIEKKLSSDIIEVEPKISVKVREIQDDDIDKMKKYISPKKVSVLESRMEDRKYLGIVAENSEGEITSFGWAVLGSYFDEHHGFIIFAKEKETVFIDDVTFPPFRGNKLQSVLANKRIEYLKKRNYTKAYGIYYPSTEITKRNYAKLGYREIYNLYVIKIFNKFFQINSGKYKPNHAKLFIPIHKIADSFE